ncbi:MAG: BACON domain-containing protein [Opitutaceae bacterium]
MYIQSIRLIRFFSFFVLGVTTVFAGSVSPTAKSVPATGQTYPFLVIPNTSTTTWNLNGSNGYGTWTSPSPEFGVGTQYVTVVVSENENLASRFADFTLTSGGKHRVTQAGAASHLTVSKTSISAPYSGGNYSVTITCNPDLTWRTRWSPGFGGPQPAHFGNGVPLEGSGNRTFIVSFQQNPLNVSYTQTLYIESNDGLVIPQISRAITVTQAAGPAFTNIDQANRDVPIIGETYSLAIDSNTNWSITGVPSWVSVTPTSGFADEEVEVVVQPHSGALRTATLNINGNSHVITQDLAFLYARPIPESQNHGYSSDTGTITVESNTTWSATETASWLSIVSGNSGTNDASLSYQVDANPNAIARATEISFGDESFTVTQDPAPENTQLNSTSVSYEMQGGSGSFTIASNANWTAISQVGWVSIISGASGSGNGQVNYTVDANPLDGSARIGTIAINSQVFTVNQAAGPQLVSFIDSNLEALVRDAISKPSGDLSELDLLTITELDLTGSDVASLSGLEYATNLRRIKFRGNPSLDTTEAWGILDGLQLSLLTYDLPRPGGAPGGVPTQLLTDTSGATFYMTMHAPLIPLLDLAEFDIDPLVAANVTALQVFKASGLANVSPAAVASYVVTNTLAGSVDFDTTAAFDLDGTIVSYLWTWSGGAEVGPDPELYFPSGTTKVTLTVTDDAGATGIALIAVEVLPPLNPGKWVLPYFDGRLELIGGYPASIAIETPIQILQMSASYNYFAAVDTRGKLWIPNWDIPEDELWGYTQVAAGAFDVIALTEAGGVVGWEQNTYAQLDLPDEIQSGVISIANGNRGSFSLALKDDGSVIAWGDNSVGQTDVPATALSGVVAIDAGGHTSSGFALALKQDGSVVAWGANEYGQTDVPDEALSDVTAIAAGDNHALALKDDGTIVAWGGNSYSQVTVPSEVSSSVVVAVAAGSSFSMALRADGTVALWGKQRWNVNPSADAFYDVAAISAGDSSAIVKKLDGSIRGWGHSRWWDLGNDIEFDVQKLGAGVALKHDGGIVTFGTTNQGILNVPIEAQSGVVDFAAQTVVLKDDGSVFAWKLNQLQPIPVQAQSGVVDIAYDGFNLFCLKDDGSVFGWGDGWGGGNVYSIPVAAQSNVSKIVASRFRAVLALKESGEVIAWGDNHYGITDLPLSAQSDVVDISIGYYHGLALKSDGSVVSWGDNQFTQADVPEAALSGVVQVSANEYSSFALKYDGSVVSWGRYKYALPRGERVYALSGADDQTNGFAGGYVYLQKGALGAATFADVAASSGLTGTNAGLTAVPHGDGIENVLKYAFNMNLSGSDAHSMTAGGTSGLPLGQVHEESGQSYWRVQYVVRKDSGLTYVPMKTDDLTQVFVPMSAMPIEEDVDDEWIRITVDEPCDPATEPKCFSHVQVLFPDS